MNDHVVIPGIGIGGMTDKYEIKILICYLLYSVHAPLSREQLNLIFQEEQLVNYFSFCSALTELIKSDHLSVKKTDTGEVYTLKPFGIETAERLSHSLPASLRDNVVKTAMGLIARVKIEQENEVAITPSQNGYTVHFRMHDGSFDIMTLELFAPDLIQAEKIKENYLKDPLRIYRGLSTLLIEE